MANSVSYEKLQNGSDVRGVSIAMPGQVATLTAAEAENIAAGFAAWLSNKLGKPIAGLSIGIGRDSRISGPALLEAVCKKLASMGVIVLDCGLTSSPAMFMTTVTPGYEFDGAIMLTASHLPYNRNGMKFYTRDGGTDKLDVTTILQIAQTQTFSEIDGGRIHEVDFTSVYAAQLVSYVRRSTGRDRPLEGFRIVVDAGNGAGGFYVSKVLEPLGADTTGSQFLEPDGNFPNHIPNPEDEHAMQAIIDCCKRNNADFGIIFDTDVDRAGAVDENGGHLNRNRLIALVSAVVLSEHSGTTVVTDSITSSGLKQFIESHGGIHHRFRRGYKNVINEAIRLNNIGRDCQIAIETSGHCAFKENYFLDDGAFLITRLLVALSKNPKLSTLVSDLREPLESIEFRFNIKVPDFKRYGDELLRDLEAYAREQGWAIAPNNYEGVRVSFPEGAGNGWFLLRLSLHDPLMPLNIESDSAGGTLIISRQLYSFLQRYSDLDIYQLYEYIFY